jgi:hypothetical protein
VREQVLVGLGFLRDAGGGDAMPGIGLPCGHVLGMPSASELQLDARRIWLGNAWHWDLKPDFKPGDVIELRRARISPATTWRRHGCG